MFKAQIASTAACKNDGRGQFFSDIVSRFGYISNSHEIALNRIQLNSMYNWHRTRSDQYKRLRAVVRKKYINREKKRKKNNEKYMGIPMSLQYEKDIDGKSSNVDAPSEPPNKRQKVDEYSVKCTHKGCSHRGFKTKNHWYHKHVATHNSDVTNVSADVCIYIETHVQLRQSQYCVICFIFLCFDVAKQVNIYDKIKQVPATSALNQH